MRLKLSSDGSIRSDDEAFDRELDTCLNLNLPFPKRNRKAVLAAVKRFLNKTPGTRSPSELRRLLRKWQSTDESGKLQPFSEVAVYYLSPRSNQQN